MLSFPKQNNYNKKKTICNNCPLSFISIVVILSFLKPIFYLIYFVKDLIKNAVFNFVFLLLADEVDGANIDSIDVVILHESGYFEHLGAKTEKCLEVCFTAWGKFFATYPWLTLLGGLLFVAALGSGIKFLNITTDPVQLWASPQSRSRVEREFFDSKFQPFYRIEQIIIKAVDLPDIIHNTSNGPIQFGPVFDKQFLTDVYYLQEDIKNLGKDIENATMLKDICFAPLVTDVSATKETSNCVVQSIWGYFQDDLERLDDDDDDNGFKVSFQL